MVVIVFGNNECPVNRSHRSTPSWLCSDTQLNRFVGGNQVFKETGANPLEFLE
jgi:hypothetical protein